MLDYLVTSKARRRLLRLLFAENVEDSVSALARRARVGVTSAHRELQAMRAHGLAVARLVGREEVFRAELTHPLVEVLRALASTPTGVRSVSTASDDDVRGELMALGAPLYGTPRMPVSVEEALVRGVALAHRDGTVASVLPVCFYLQRDNVCPTALTKAAKAACEGPSVGLFLATTSEVSGDPCFAKWASGLRDGRRRGTHYFFVGDTFSKAARAVAEETTPPVAKRWGFVMSLDLDTMRSTFQKHAHA